MSHSHAHEHATSTKLIVATIATFLFVCIELAAGLTSHSLALIGDAFHNFTDAVALILALVAVKLETRPPTDEKSFGYQRAGILAAFINAGTLLAITVYLVWEAIERLRTPEKISSNVMLVTAAAAIALNTAITFALHREGKEDINIRSAVVHMFGDAVSSAGIVIAAMLIRITGSPRWDSFVSLAIAALILWSSWGILKESVNLLLEGTPSGIDPGAVVAELNAIDGVEGVHHLHIWALGPSRPALSCHLMVGDVPVRSTSALLDQVTDMLHRRFRIVHATVQFEFAECADDDPHCVPYTAHRHS